MILSFVRAGFLGKTKSWGVESWSVNAQGQQNHVFETAGEGLRLGSPEPKDWGLRSGGSPLVARPQPPDISSLPYCC